MNHKRNQSQIDFANPNPKKVTQQDKSTTPTSKRHFCNEQGNSVMSGIISYKNALAYRDEACGLAVAGKVNQISTVTLAKHQLGQHTMQERKKNNQVKMNKAKEMQSSL